MRERVINITCTVMYEMYPWKLQQRSLLRRWTPATFRRPGMATGETIIEMYLGQFFSECTIGNVQHVGIHVYPYIPLVHSGKN